MNFLGVFIFHLSEKNKHLYILSHDPWTDAFKSAVQLQDHKAFREICF